jgi:hypothetical protein
LRKLKVEGELGNGARVVLPISSDFIAEQILLIKNARDAVGTVQAAPER